MDDLLDVAVRSAMEAGRIQKERYQGNFRIDYKGEIDPVTEVDLACQDRIIDLIAQSFPGDEVISEEKTNYYDGKGRKWIIDPLDGTTNYTHGYPFFCTSIACEEDGEITLGVVYNPIFNEMFTARKGLGAYLNGQPIRVSRIGMLKKALLSTGFPYDLPTSKRNNISNFVSFLYLAQAIRRDGSAALNLSYLACGRFDAHWEMKLNPWDVAAGYLIVLEAGGVVTTFDGGSFSIYGKEILATNGLIHGEMMAVLGKDREAEGH
jgi:myo-inositol-1(or 4)-monophosphatase